MSNERDFSGWTMAVWQPERRMPWWRRRIAPGGGVLVAVLLSALAWLPVVAVLHVLWRWM